MFNKLFGKILDSSIWLEPTSTRIVWITMLAAMDQDGYAHFSAIENLANRARVANEEARIAVECFLAPDPNSSNPKNEGRRIERVPGGFMVLNAEEHRNLMNQAIQREKTRERVARFRAKNNPKCNDERYTPVSSLLPVLRGNSGNDIQKQSTDTEADMDICTEPKGSLSSGESKSGQADGLTPDAVMVLWNTLADPRCARCRVMTKARVASAKARVKELHDPADWELAIQAMNASDFHMGENARKWIADIDWFLRPGGVVKMREQADIEEQLTPAEIAYNKRAWELANDPELKAGHAAHIADFGDDGFKGLNP